MRSVTAVERAAFADDGVVCLRGALDPAVVLGMAVPVEVALRGGESADLTAMGEALAVAGNAVLRDGGADQAAGRFVSGVDHWKARPEFAAFACDSALPRLVAELLGTDGLWLYEDSVLVKEPSTAERTAWHQDIGYFHVEGEQLATTWCPLDSVRPETGAVRYVRGSHRWVARYRPNLFVSELAIPGTEGELTPDIDALAAAGECGIIMFSTEPGDVVVHHARTLHGAGANTSATERRRAISVRYCGDDAVVCLRPGAPHKPHQATWTDGAPFRAVDPVDHPRVWPPR